jgi:hypothetical protein
VKFDRYAKAASRRTEVLAIRTIPGDDRVEAAQGFNQSAIRLAVVESEQIQSGIADRPTLSAKPTNGTTARGIHTRTFPLRTASSTVSSPRRSGSNGSIVRIGLR